MKTRCPRTICVSRSLSLFLSRSPEPSIIFIREKTEKLPRSVGMPEIGKHVLPGLVCARNRKIHSSATPTSNCYRWIAVTRGETAIKRRKMKENGEGKKKEQEEKNPTAMESGVYPSVLLFIVILQAPRCVHTSYTGFVSSSLAFRGCRSNETRGGFNNRRMTRSIQFDISTSRALTRY